MSVATWWEIAIKSGLGKLTLTEPAGVLLARELPQNGFHLLPVEFKHATYVEALPMHHRDPFDRLLIAQAALENLGVVSIDSQFDSYGVTRVW